MKTISAGTIKTSFPLPVEAETIRRRRHFYIHIPGIPAARKVLAKEYNRFLWMAVIMLVQSILVAPIVSVTILSTGNWKPLWFAAAACIYAAFLPCLSGQNLKWIKLVFFHQLPPEWIDHRCGSIAFVHCLKHRYVSK